MKLAMDLVEPSRQSDVDDGHLSVREALDRVGLALFPNEWTGKEYLDHWRLGLPVWPTSKLRGMHAAKELIRRVKAGEAIVEVESIDGAFVRATFEVRHFHGAWSMCAGEDEAYVSCRIQWVSPKNRDPSSTGRKGFDYPDAVVRILKHLERSDCNESADEITHTIRAQYEREGLRVPSYSRLQPFVSKILVHRRGDTNSFPDRIVGTAACSDPQKQD